MHTRLLRLSLGLTAAVTALTCSIGAASAVGATARTESPAAALRAPTIEALARYVPADSCDPTAKPGTTALGDLLVARYPGSSYGISRSCGTDPLPTSEHYEGRALDWMTSVRVPAQRAHARAVLRWLFATDAAGNRYANARRLGVMYVIWNNKIWGAYRAADGWRPYAACAAHPQRAYDTTCHRDHIHISLSWEGAMRRTSYWTGRVAAVDYGPCRAADLNWAAPYVAANPRPCPSHTQVRAPRGASALLVSLTTYSGMHVARGSTGPVVRAIQQAVRAPVDGTFGTRTRSVLRAWQTAHRLAVTGVVDPATWRALLAANGAVSSLTPYSHTTLRTGSHGPAVVALQRVLGVTADGIFGSGTRAAVNAFKRAHHLPVNGVVRHGMWLVLGA